MPSSINSPDDTSLAETRRGRAWIDQVRWPRSADRTLKVP